MRHTCSIWLSVLVLAPLTTALPGAVSPAAQEARPAPPRAEQAPRADDAAREVRRVFHLHSGQTIRVVSKQVDGQWQYRSRDQWKPLQAAAVARVELESEALADFERARAAADLKSTAHRVELARLAFDHGLVQEGLDQLEFVLRAEPDSAPALALLGERWLMSVPSLDVPAEQAANAQAALLRFGAGAPLAVRELAIIELRKAVEDPGLRATLDKELRSTIDVRRSFAALALRRLYPGESVKPLLMHAVLDPSESVRRDAALGLKAVQEPGLVVPVVKALESRNGTVRLRAAEALGNMGYAAAVEPLIARMAAVSAAAQAGGGRLPHSHIFVGRQIAYVQDFDVEVAQFQAVADPQVNVLIEGQVTDAAVAGEMVVESVTESVVLRRALGQLVGQKVGDTNKKWLAWWAENKGDWQASEKSKPVTPTAKGS